MTQFMMMRKDTVFEFQKQQEFEFSDKKKNSDSNSYAQEDDSSDWRSNGTSKHSNAESRTDKSNSSQTPRGSSKSKW